MIIGIGTDMVHIPRIAKLLEQFGERFVARILTPNEIAKFNTIGAKTHFLAKRFAAKEAASKALGCGIGAKLSFHDMEVSNNADGAPAIELSSHAKQYFSNITLHLSLSDEHQYALAFVVAQKNPH